MGWEERSPQNLGGHEERKVLLDEFLATCDTLTADIIVRRSRKQKWREIGAAYGIRATSARLRFRKAMLRMRAIIERKGPPG